MIKYIALLILAIPLAAYAWMSPVMLGGGVASSGGGLVVEYRNHECVNNDDEDGTISLNMPSGTTTGDIMIAFVATDSSSSMTNHTDFTQMSGETVNSTMIAESYFRIFVADDTGPWAWSVFADDALACVITFKKASGTWTDPDTAGYVSSSGEISATSTVGSITAATDDSFVAMYFNDGFHTVSTAPSGMTEGTKDISGGDAMAAAIYYEEGATSGAKTPALVWSASDDVIAIGVLIHAE